MYTESEFDKVYDIASTFNFCCETIMKEEGIEIFRALSSKGLDPEDLEHAGFLITLLVRRDILVCYYHLGYPTTYKKNRFGYFEVLNQLMSSEIKYINYSDYKVLWTSSIYSEVRKAMVNVYESVKNMTESLPGTLLFYNILLDIDKSWADYYIDYIQKMVLDIGGDNTMVTEKGRKWRDRVLQNPTFLSQLNTEEDDKILDEQLVYSVDQQYYDLIYKVAKELDDFIKEYYNSKTLLRIMRDEERLRELVYDNDSLTRYIKIFAISDLANIYTKLNHSVNIDTLEGKFILIFMALNCGLTCDYDTFNQLCNPNTPYSDVRDLRFSMINLLNSQTSAPEFEIEGFKLNYFFSKLDATVGKKYMVLMYRCASVIAKADGVIDDVESQWLSHLLMLSDNVSLSEDSEEPVVIENKENSNPIEELNSLIGLDTVKTDVVSLANFIKMKQLRESKGLKAPSISYHCVFTGNPGTGKTTVARILASIFKELGLLKRGHLIETDRSGLVAEYVGQTAVKTNKIIDSALDGVLFVDEAYTLVGGQNDYGKEAIATLLKRMEDDRDRLIVILAGYSREMEDFINSNPGLRSRFNRYIHFPDYSSSELLEIFNLNVAKNEYSLTSEAEDFVKGHLEKLVDSKSKDFGNARYVRNYFEMAIENQANRLASELNINTEILSQIVLSDVETILNQRIHINSNIGF